MKQSLVQYIYRIFYKIAKRQTAEFRSVIFENFRHESGEMSDILKVFEVDDILVFWDVSQIELYQLSCIDCIATNRFGTNVPYYVTLEEKA